MGKKTLKKKVLDSEFVESLRYAKERYDAGDEKVIWNLVCFCDLNDIPFPHWLHRAVIDYAWAPRKSKTGRPSEAKRNKQIVQAVDRHRRQVRPFGRKRKLRHVSLAEACERVAQNPTLRGQHLSALTIRGIYLRKTGSKK